jgi:hypothetical protein
LGCWTSVLAGGGSGEGVACGNAWAGARAGSDAAAAASCCAATSGPDSKAASAAAVVAKGPGSPPAAGPVASAAAEGPTAKGSNWAGGIAAAGASAGLGSGGIGWVGVTAGFLGVVGCSSSAGFSTLTAGPLPLLCRLSCSGSVPGACSCPCCVRDGTGCCSESASNGACWGGREGEAGCDCAGAAAACCRGLELPPAPPLPLPLLAGRAALAAAALEGFFLGRAWGHAKALMGFQMPEEQQTLPSGPASLRQHAG